MQNYSRHYNLPSLNHLGNRAILEAVEINYGNILKSGDTTTLKYNLLDGDGEILDLSNMTAVAVLKKDNKEWYRTNAEIETNTSNGYIAKFKINETLPPSGKNPYILEFIVSDEEERYIFPSDNDIELHIVSSSFSLDEEAVLDAGKKAVDGAVERFILDNSQMFKGDKGDQGIQGPKGDKGDKGDQGEQGPKGPAGTYTAGSNITINNDVISATDTVFDNGPNNTRLGALEGNVGKIKVGGIWYTPQIVTELPASPSSSIWYIILE